MTTTPASRPSSRRRAGFSRSRRRSSEETSSSSVDDLPTPENLGDGMDLSQVDFALALHDELPADGNLPWSPYSVASALGLAATGARGRTYDELARALAPGGDLVQLGRTLAASARLDDAAAAVANTIWVRLGLELRDAYRQEMLDWPGGALHTADFRGDPEGSRGTINADVEKTTQGLIKELLQRGTITPTTAAVIVNALYLKVAWRNPFADAATQPAPFHAPSGTREVPTMRQQERMGYAAVDGWRMVTLSTASDVVVDVLLSDEDGRLTPETLTGLYRRSTATRVDLALPRFRVETEAVLNDALGRLGVVTAFTRDADFSGISPAERIWIDKVVHKAVLRVDEQGFEGAAATRTPARSTSWQGSSIPDRPFQASRGAPQWMVCRSPTGNRTPRSLALQARRSARNAVGLPVPPAGVEPAASTFGGSRSSAALRGCAVRAEGFDPPDLV